MVRHDLIADMPGKYSAKLVAMISMYPGTKFIITSNQPSPSPALQMGKTLNS